MSAPSSVEELLQLIRKSGMIDEQKLSVYLQRRQAGRGLPDDPREAADAMMRDGLLTGFQAEQFLLGKWRGFTIGKYKLLERIGVGGMGQVFLCEHTFMNRRVAIKVLPPAKAEQPAALGRFYREARAAGSIEHPNIVRTHDIDQDGNLHFIVMEYVDGSNLLDMVKKFGPMEIPRALHYIRQVALGLDYAFRNGIIHRDIKPGNILVNRVGTAKLLDMGLARFYNDHSDNLTVKYDDKIVLGTADYVAPEQVANSHGVDIRADIYALGASLYFLLAGHPPFPTGTVSQKLLWHRTKDPTPIRQLRSEVPEEIAAVVAKMMHKDPNQRFQTPGEIAAILERWIPEHVPAPKPEEMPTLSPAAQQVMEESGQFKVVEEPPASVSARQIAAARASLGQGAFAAGMTGVAAPPLSEIRSRAVTKPAPFAPPTMDETPEPSVAPAPRLSHTGTKSLGPLPPAAEAPPAVTRPGSRSSSMPDVSRSRLEPVPHPPLATDGSTESPHLARLQRVAQGSFPVIAMPPAEKNETLKRNLFFALIGMSLVLIVGLLGWKLGANSKAPAPTSTATITSDQATEEK